MKTELLQSLTHSLALQTRVSVRQEVRLNHGQCLWKQIGLSSAVAACEEAESGEDVEKVAFCANTNRITEQFEFLGYIILSSL